jgi:hypothetical protein
MKELYFYPTLNEGNASRYGVDVEEFSFCYNEVTLEPDEAGVLRNPSEKS